jgi:predicted Rossmann fold flavoprotein
MSDFIKKDVIIMGAGASGLFCAIECGKRNRSVLVLDHADRVCSKVLISGGGRCNFTNLNVSEDNYISNNPRFCCSALARFTTQNMLSLLRKHHILWHEKEAGRLFCVNSSREIVEMLKSECDKAGVQIRLGCRIETVEKKEKFTISTSHGAFTSDSLVVATGGLSYQNVGATGFGHALARQFGLGVTEVRPGLAPFRFKSHDQKLFGRLAGISLDASAATRGKKSFRGNILFTHRGLSGPAALQASSYWKNDDAVVVDLLPGIDLDAVFAAERRSRIELRTLLSRFFPKRLAETWCELYAESRPMIQYSDKELRSIEARLHAWEIMPAGTEGYSQAEVTTGGVNTEGISSKTMEVRTIPGLFFIGEVLDVTGHLGGYNLHWAWASAHAAGQFA